MEVMTHLIQLEELGHFPGIFTNVGNKKYFKKRPQMKKSFKRRRNKSPVENARQCRAMRGKGEDLCETFSSPQLNSVESDPQVSKKTVRTTFFGKLY